MLKKEYAVVAATKPGLSKKASAKRTPLSKVKASTQETMKFTLEPGEEEEAASGKKRKKESGKPLPE